MNFRLVDGPNLFPGHTLVHRTPGDTEQVVDTNVDLFGEYRVYLSRSEVHQAARLYGYVDPDEHVRTVGALEEQLAAAYRELETVKANMSVPLADVIDFAKEKARIELERERASSRQPVA